MTKLPIKWSEMSKTLNQQKKTEVKFEVPSCDPKREFICNLSQTVRIGTHSWYTNQVKIGTRLKTMANLTN